MMVVFCRLSFCLFVYLFWKKKRKQKESKVMYLITTYGKGGTGRANAIIHTLFTKNKNRKRLQDVTVAPQKVCVFFSLMNVRCMLVENQYANAGTHHPSFFH